MYRPQQRELAKPSNGSIDDLSAIKNWLVINRQKVPTPDRIYPMITSILNDAALNDMKAAQ